jgi:hypothetical protein
VPGDVQQDVAVVSVLDLKDVAHQRISSQRVAEVVDCLASRFGLLAVLIVEVLKQSWQSLLASDFLPLFLNCMNAHGITDHFNQATPGTGGNDFVWPKPKRALGFLEDLVHAADQLHRKGLLSDVIIRLYDQFDQPPRSKRTEW